MSLTERSRSTGPTCAQVDELAGLYVLDALEAADARAVAEHLATCQATHDVFAELASAAGALTGTVQAIDAPSELRSRVVAAIKGTSQEVQRPVERSSASVAPAPVALPQAPAPVRIPSPPRRRWSMAGLAAAAVLVVVVVGGLGISAWQRAGDAEARLALLRRAVAASADPAANVASLLGSDSAVGASGFAVFPDDGMGFIVLDGLPAAPANDVYQAWYLADGVPTSAGVMAVGGDGLAVLTGLDPVAGTDTIALTVEPAPGSAGPTSTPIVVGELRVSTA